MPFGLNHETVSKILTVFSEYREVNQAILYGSRALGTQREESDIDLTLTGKDLDLRILNRIESDLDDLLLPYTFDLSLYRQINNESLINHIERVGIIFYARESNLPSPGNAALRSGSSSAANTEIGDPG